MITKRNFNSGMRRLEQIFNRGESLTEAVREEYFTALCYEKPQVFEGAIQLVIETFKPYLSEPFPSVATVKIATLRVVDEDEEEAGHKPEIPGNVQGKDFCEQCRNQGFFLGHDNQAHFCDCERGRYRKAAWSIPWNPGDRKRQEKTQKALEKLPPAEPPHRGLKEWNPAGFWEETQEEHDKWMTAKRAEIDEIDARRARDREPDGERADRVSTGLLRAVKGVLAQVSGVRQGIKELEEDPEAAF